MVRTVPVLVGQSVAVRVAVGVAVAVAVGGCGGGAGPGASAAPTLAADTARTPSTGALGWSGETGAPAAQPITVVAPAEGATTDRTFTATGVGSAVEGTLLWQLLDGAGTAVRTGSTTAGSMAPGPFRFTVAGPAAGRYTLRIYRVPARDDLPTIEVRRTFYLR